MNVRTLILLAGLSVMYWSSPAADAAIMGFWQFEEASGDALDSSGNGNDGTVLGGATRTAFPAPTPYGNTQSMSFDGDGDKVDMGSGVEVGATDFTLESFVYVNTNGASNFGNIVGKVVSGVFSDKGWQLSTRPDAANGGGEAGPGKFKVLFRTRDGGPSNDIFSADLDFNNWYHVAGVRSGGNVSLYIGGVLAGTQGIANSGDYTSAQAFSVGAATTGGGDFANALNGYVDEVRLSNVALEPSQFLLNVPEPHTIMLLGIGAMALCLRGLRRRK